MLKPAEHFTSQYCLTPDMSQTLPSSQNFVTSQCIVVLISTSLSGYALLNASQTAANDFSAK
jgi:hypothetical protein